MDVDVDVDVIDPVAVAALVSENETVGVIDTPWTSKIAQFRQRRHDAFEQLAAPHPSVASVHGVDHAHGVVPVHERGHGHGVDHVHVHVHVADNVEAQTLFPLQVDRVEQRHVKSRAPWTRIGRVLYACVRGRCVS